jgi:hypothetical protein
LITEVANVRETPYLTSSQVTSVPSCQVTPSRSVNAHVLPPSEAVPRSVAMSGVIEVPCFGSAEYTYEIRDRIVVPPKNARSSPV